MRNAIQQGFSFVLPIIVLIIVPYSIEKHLSLENKSALVAGFILICAGFYLMFLTISALIKKGNGTLAPWSPTKKLVTAGIYGYLRNPMILGVFTVLTGESLSILSVKIFIWAVIFFVINNIFFLIYEEPNLEKRFGDDYRKYKSEVPRWFPKIKQRDSLTS